MPTIHLGLGIVAWEEADGAYCFAPLFLHPVELVAEHDSILVKPADTNSTLNEMLLARLDLARDQVPEDLPETARLIFTHGLRAWKTAGFWAFSIKRDAPWLAASIPSITRNCLRIEPSAAWFWLAAATSPPKRGDQTLQLTTKWPLKGRTSAIWALIPSRMK